MQFKLDGELNQHPLLLHDEPVYRDGKLCGHTTSGGRGFRIQASLCFAYVNHPVGQSKNDLLAQRYEVRVCGKNYVAKPLAEAPYDPRHRRMMG